MSMIANTVETIGVNGNCFLELFGKRIADPQLEEFCNVGKPVISPDSPSKGTDHKTWGEWQIVVNNHESPSG